MSATVTVSVRIPLKQISLIRKAAQRAGVKLATFVRDGAYHHALVTLNTPSPDDRDIARALTLAVRKRIAAGSK
jgi:hypothetical protein